MVTLYAARRLDSVPEWDGLGRLALLSACFFLGTLGGFFFSILSGGGSELHEYLLRYFQAAGRGEWAAPSLVSAVWDVFRWPAAAFLLGFTALGAAAIPLLLLVRGFLLSFAATTFAGLFGLSGVAASAASFGVTVLLSVPVLFAVAQSSFRAALLRLPAASGPPATLGERLAEAAPCAGLLALAAALQRTVMPAVFTAVCARLFAG